MTAPSPELAILRHLAGRPYAGAGAIGAACAMAPGEVRARLVMLESMRLVAGRPDPDAGRSGPRRVYVVTAEGRRKAGVSDRLWSMDDIAVLVDAAAPAPGKRGPCKVRSTVA